METRILIIVFLLIAPIVLFGWRRKIVAERSFDNLIIVIGQSFTVYIVLAALVGLSTLFINYPSGFFIDTYSDFKLILNKYIIPVWLSIAVAAFLVYRFKNRLKRN